jgi:hypothetical protein
MSLQSFLRKIPGIGRFAGSTTEKSQEENDPVLDNTRPEYADNTQQTTETNEETPLKTATNETENDEPENGENTPKEKLQPGSARDGPVVKSGLRNFNIQFNMEKCEPDEKDKDRKGSGYKKLK